MIVFFAIITIAAIFRQQAFLSYVFFDETFVNIKMIFTIPIFILWVYDMIIWSKHDKHVGRFFLIFFLLGIYGPFYFRRIVKNGWQK
jgi:ABC-type protease/lipase transport system fused ATPase/permease subunit